jgi:hypothetical protein
LYAVMLGQRLLRGSFSDSAVEACERKGGVGRTDAAPAERVEDPATHARLLGAAQRVCQLRQRRGTHGLRK